jgi:hypothetical protein
MSGRPELEHTINAAVADMRALRRAFASAGLLDPNPPPAALALAGGPGGARRLRRDLLLADAFLRNRVARPRPAGGLRHVVMFGGTKVGKSSVVNMLAGAPLAPISPEGGFTRRPWAFVASAADPLEGRPLAFRDFARVAPEAAAPDHRDQYCVVRVAESALPEGVVLWDTPDCDSVGAEFYLDGLIEALSLADLVVYVTTIEKYAVAALVDWVFDLHEAGLTLLECLNKTPPRDRAPVLRKQAEDIFPRMADDRGMPVPELPVVALRPITEGDEAELWNAARHPEIAALRAEVVRRADAADAARARRAAAIDAARWVGRVLDVVRQERAVRATWEGAVGTGLAAFLRRYEQDYLQAEQVIEPFTRLNVEILRLLDIPAINVALRQIRWWSSLPSRIAIHVGRRIVSAIASRGSEAGAKELPPQAQAFANAHAELLNMLARLIETERAAMPHHPFWDRLADAWDAALPDLHAGFTARVAEQMRRTDAEIRDAAESILARLRDSPLLLNTLRGVRVGSQAGAVAVGFLVPHGGVVYDVLEEIVITPLLIDATERSADALIGSFVAQRRRDLIMRLKQDARRFATEVYRQPLQALADAARLIDLDSAILDRLPERLRALEEDAA